ncbi:hypothetical protein BSKO_07254 [Bryopsis sp. KO-2023]|nr:hypothetical protein BSKO_07254 [Bryopsis sp. KO-2023]
MAAHTAQAGVLVFALLGLSMFGGASSATVITRGSSSASGGGSAVTSSSSSVQAVTSGDGSVTISAETSSKNGGKSELNLVGVSKDGGNLDVTAEANADGDGAVAIVNALLEAAGDADLKAGIFANAIQLGQGPVIANAFVRAKAAGDEVYGEATSAFALAVATAIGKGPENAATVANTIASVIAEEGESRVAIGKSLSILIVEQGCGPIQDVIQKAEAEASSKGNQKAFLQSINVDVNLITCAFPDTCGTDGVDKRAGCCGNADAKSSGKCGACKDGKCDFRLIWANPKPIWACDTADCKNKKPCICG